MRKHSPRLARFLATLAICTAATQLVHADEAKHDLRYKFTPGETVRTKVIHQATVKTTIDGTSQTANTVSISVKNWKIESVDEEGAAQFTHSVEYVDMWNQISGREKIRYDSRQKKEPPAGFETVAKEVAVPLTKWRISPRGEVLERVKIAETAAPGMGQVTIPLPEKPVAVGEVWEFPHNVPVRLRSGEQKSIKTRQRFKLEEVSDGIAKISIETQILSPVNNPEIEAQLVQRESSGIVRFDIAAGRILKQQVDLDRRVIGYPNEASSMHYRTRFTEELLRDEQRTATAEDENRPAKK